MARVVFRGVLVHDNHKWSGSTGPGREGHYKQCFQRIQAEKSTFETANSSTVKCVGQGCAAELAIGFFFGAQFNPLPLLEARWVNFPGTLAHLHWTLELPTFVDARVFIRHANPAFVSNTIIYRH